MKFRKKIIIVIILVQIQIQTISSHREYHHNIKLRKNHHNNNNNNNNRGDSELESSTMICGNLCMASFILMVIFYLCMAAYILRYFWRKNATRKSREIRYGIGNELRMSPHNRDNSGGDWKGRKDETVIAIAYEESRPLL